MKTVSQILEQYRKFHLYRVEDAQSDLCSAVDGLKNPFSSSSIIAWESYNKAIEDVKEMIRK